MNIQKIILKYLGWCPGIKAAANFEQENSHSSLEIYSIIALSTIAIIAYLLLTKENVNVPGVIVAMTLCGIIAYYNWEAHRRDGQRPYEPVKMPFRRGEFESDREPEETYDWGSVSRHRDTLGVPWATEHLGSPTKKELEQMTPEFKEFLVICRRQPALYQTLKQIAEEKKCTLLDLARLFNEEQRKFMVLKAEESRRLSDQLMGELHRSVSGTWFPVALGGIKGYNYSERYQELRKEKMDLDNEVVEYVQRIFS